MIRITIIGADELASKLSGSGGLLKSKLSEAIRKSTEVTKQNIAREAPVWQGTLKKSIEAKSSGLTGRVGVAGSAAKYGYVQEYGRTSRKMPPVAALEKWAAAKLGDSSLAFVLARSIARKGTKPQPFFEPGTEESIPQIEQFFEATLKEFINAL
jgi:HK97 gp10 family phage protein